MFSAFNTSKSTHTWSSGQPTHLGAVWDSVPYARVSPQSWYWRWRGHSLFTPPHRQFLPEPRFEPATSGYKSDALSIRPRLPHCITFKWYFLLEPESLSVFRFPHRSVVLRSSTDQINPTTWHWPPDWWSAGGSKRSKVAVAPSCMGRYLRRPNGWGELTRPNFP